MSDPFWFKAPEILLSKKNLFQFWPSKFQTYEERLNSMTRFILYSGLILSLQKKNTSPLVFSCLLISTLVVVSKSKNKVLQKILSKTQINSNCQMPSSSNPLGNQLPFDNVNRQPGCKSYSVQDEITKNIFAEFPTNGLSNTNKDFIERQFFSTANTDIINDQKGFASWLYGAPNKKMCKSNPEHCTGFQGMQNNAGSTGASS